MSQISHPSRRGITVNSDWITMFEMVGLLIMCGLLLRGEIDRFVWGQLKGPVLLHKSFWGIWNKVFETIAAILLFVCASIFTQKHVKIACVLMGTDLAGFVLLSCFNISPSVRHIAAVSGSVIRQIAFVIFCVAIVQWLTRVIRWDPPPESQGGDR